MAKGRAYALEQLEWNVRLGRLGYNPRLRGVGLQIVQKDKTSEVWVPLGLGFFWRKRRRAWTHVIRKRDL